MTNKHEGYKYANPIIPAKIMMPYEEDEIARALKDFISIDKDIEGVKCLLALKSDFNLEDAYKIFDIESKGNFNLRELEEALSILRIYPKREELQFMIQVYDED